MTGAIVTSSGDFHRGFHQTPNVLRDKYMPLIGGDGYGYLNYLLSWANANATLSIRRMKQDLKWSQDKLERIQSLVLEHCSHFVSITVGDRVKANQWHLDMEKVWAENALHMAQSYAERMAAKGVPEIGAPPQKPRKGVPKTGTGGVPEVGARGVPEIGTYKDNDLNTPEKRGGVSSLEGDEQPGQPEHSSSGNAALQTHEAGPLPSEPLTSSPPDGGAAHTAEQGDLIQPQIQDQPPAGEASQATNTEHVPGGGAAAGGLTVDTLRPLSRGVLAERPVALPDSATYRGLKALVGNSLGTLLKESTRTGSLPRALWLQLDPVEVDLVRATAQREAKVTQGNMITLAVRGLDRLIGAVKASSAAQGVAVSARAVVTPNGASLDAAKPLEQVADVVPTDRYAPGAQWQPVAGGAVQTLTHTSSSKTRTGAITLYHLSGGLALKSFELMRDFDHVGV
ncbi:hypothetical protein K7W42_20430 [Deinococcus sp. HMF7604]|uniref:hypothetical protein n=1 Tax=Deinococcus betulae TaxID=2873312 RepID=UPI001CCD9951|nr:hypothetical protein [Deinococcus betulae]MBZ9753207.1 hypothetical protein [Deinococcus betulae]